MSGSRTRATEAQGARVGLLVGMGVVSVVTIIAAGVSASPVSPIGIGVLLLPVGGAVGYLIGRMAARPSAS